MVTPFSPLKMVISLVRGVGRTQVAKANGGQSDNHEVKRIQQISALQPVVDQGADYHDYPRVNKRLVLIADWSTDQEIENDLEDDLCATELCP
jgi:hypothetical protein